MQDPIYRGEVAHRYTGFEQSPVPGCHLGFSPADAANAAPVIQRTAEAKKPDARE
jgi:hypothetical protein